MISETLIPLTFFAVTAVVIIFIRKYINEERMALIEKGTNAEIFNFQKNGNWALRLGLLFVGAGFGLLVGTLLDTYTAIREESAYFSMIFLFGGIGLISSYFVERKSKV